MSEELVQRILEGNRRALARALTHVENRTPEGFDILARLYPRTGRAHIVGVTGPAGSGKSTLVGAVARELRRRGKRIGIVAVDPSSPFTQGAILGDRIRMQDLTSDTDVFLRSMATRGSLGGLSATAGDVAAVLDAAGFDAVILETVGAGQDEVEVANMAQTTVVVNTPGAGDAVQALKAGILEIADILVVNKADYPGADALVTELETMLGLSPDSDYRPPIMRTVAAREEGIAELVDTIQEHRRTLEASGLLDRRREERARGDIMDAVQTLLMRRFADGAERETIEDAVRKVAERKLDPHSAARDLTRRLFPTE